MDEHDKLVWLSFRGSVLLDRGCAQLLEWLPALSLQELDVEACCLSKEMVRKLEETLGEDCLQRDGQRTDTSWVQMGAFEWG